MAAGGAWPVVLLLLFVLWDSARTEDMDEGQVSAPPELLAKVPAAAEAIVAAGYTSMRHEGANTTPPPPVATVVVSNFPGARGGTSRLPLLPSISSATKETFLIVGDTRYAWQEWSAWHCNCPASSMSRVRDITYSTPGLQLDPLQYNVLRFEREPCTYNACACDQALGQCNQTQVPCDRGATHLCALQDIEYDQLRRKERFWTLVREKFKELLNAIKEMTPNQAKESQRRARH